MYDIRWRYYDAKLLWRELWGRAGPDRGNSTAKWRRLYLDAVPLQLD